MTVYSEYDVHAAGSSQAAARFWLGPNRPLHSIIGSGRVADVLLWRNKTLSASILAGFSTIWFLFEVVELHFVTMLCYILMLSMLLLFTWIQASNFFKWGFNHFILILFDSILGLGTLCIENALFRRGRQSCKARVMVLSVIKPSNSLKIHIP
ncbi:reticulon-like protein B14 isoform X2 [Silene latifolia]|uniref:reticulon-like protein B14 isoform X2 n=1 Tax=Silene latifolia TaxID=37657 RepID=UPI003D77104C